MKVGMNLLLWTAGANEQHFPLLTKIRRWGFDGVEFPMFSPDGSPWQAIAAECKRLGLGRTAVTVMPAGANLIGDAEEERRAGVEHLKACVDACVTLGAEALCGPLCSPVGRLVGRGPTAEEKSRAADALREVGKHAAGKNVAVIVEGLNRFETYFPNCQADLSSLIDEVGHPSVGQMYDTFHANIEEKNIEEAVKAGGKRIRHIHISANDRATPGEDHIDYAATFRALRGIGYDGWLTIEAFGSMLPELAGATCIWRKMYRDEDSLASEGARFVRRMWAESGEAKPRPAPAAKRAASKSAAPKRSAKKPKTTKRKPKKAAKRAPARRRR